MLAFVPIPGQITDREALWVIRQGREPTQAVSVQKPFPVSQIQPIAICPAFKSFSGLYPSPNLHVCEFCHNDYLNIE
ncbi:hypothetical protein BF17_08130 [Yersinia similis]|uniref:Uncharacterized protein n=1 Tax=Yersinia similis TaxID=367190 RepID=A0ABM5Q4E0_9GAMM|nr:hypothetical protein BF17_08130 [Yersinia similis]